MRKIVLREARKEDWQVIEQIHRDHQAAQGSSYDLPNLFALPVILALVGVDENDAIRNVVYAEAIAELRFVGCDPVATAFSQREADGFAYVLRNLGYRCLDCCVPRSLKKMIGKPLRRARFKCIDQEFSLFTRDLR